MKRSVAVAVLAVLMLSSGQAHASDSLPVTTSVLQRWSQAHVVGRSAMTRSHAIQIARTYNVATGTKQMFTSYLPEMREANPRLTLLVYMNGAFDTSDGGKAYPESWYARSASGAKIRSVNWGSYLMDVSKPAWADEAARICTEYLRISKYDGCYVDALGTAALGKTHTFTNAVPIDPRTNKPWTEDDYLRATASIASSINAANPGRPVVANGIGSGQHYFDDVAPTSRLLRAADAGHSEVWLRTGTSGINDFKNEADWKQSVDMLVDAGVRGKPMLTLTKLWVNATNAQIRRWHKYTLASFLLGTDGSSFYTFTAKLDVTEVVDDHPWERVKIGQPLSRYTKVGRAYVRPFTRGKAVVNPTAGSVTVSLGGSYLDLDGLVRSSVTLGPHRGEVFVTR